MEATIERTRNNTTSSSSDTLDDIEKGEKNHRPVKIQIDLLSDANSSFGSDDSGSEFSASCKESGGGSDASNVYLEDLDAFNHSENNKDDNNNSSSPPWAGKDLLRTAKKVIEEDNCWKSFLVQHETRDSLEVYGKTSKKSTKSEESQKENKEEEEDEKQKTNHDNSSACWSSEYYSATDSDDESSFQSKLIDEEEEESVIDGPVVQEDFSVDESVDSKDFSLGDGDNCLQMDDLLSKQQFSNLQASLLKTTLNGTNKRKDQDHKRIVQLEQALATSEGMIADVIAETNLQHKERDMADSLLQSAYEKISAHDIQIAEFKSLIEDAAAESRDQEITIDLLELQLKKLNKRKGQDHKRIVQLEQALTTSEDMIADVIAETNLQHKERDMADSLLQSAYEKISAHDIQMAEFKSLIEDAAAKSRDQEMTIAQLEVQLKKQKEVQANDKTKYQSKLDLSASLLLDAYALGESREQEIVQLQEAVKQMKAERGNEDIEKIEMACRLEEALMKLKLATDKVPELESDLRIMKAKYVLDEHFRKREKTNALFNQMKQRLMKKIGLLDRRGQLLSNRLEEHLEKHKREVGQKELLIKQLQDTRAKLTLQKGIVTCLQNDLKQLSEQKHLEQQQVIIGHVAQKQRLKNELTEIHHVKPNELPKMVQILESDLVRLKEQNKNKDLAEKQLSALQAKLRFATAKESLLSKALSAKNSDGITQEERLKEMSDKLASMRSQLCMKQSQNELLATRLEALQQEKDEHSRAIVESGSGATESLASGKSSDKNKKNNCNRKVNSLEAELSLLQVPDVVVTDASLIGSWSCNESGNNDEDNLNHGSTSDGSSGLLDDFHVPEVTSDDEDDWDFLSHSKPTEQHELWC